MGKLVKTLGIAAIVLGLKGSYHLGKLVAEDERYDVIRREGAAYLVDGINHTEARLDETKPVYNQPAFCSSASTKGHSTLDGYVNQATRYLRHTLE